MSTSMFLLFERLKTVEIARPKFFDEPIGVMPLVSVILPVYNTGTILLPAVQSILGQSYKNLEVFLVDDGSSDNSVEIARMIAETDERVTILHVPTGCV